MTDGALRKHLKLLSDGHAPADIELASLALLRQVDVHRPHTTATHARAGTVVDGAFARDGAFFFVERGLSGATLFDRERISTLRSQCQAGAIAEGNLIMLIGMPLGKPAYLIQSRAGVWISWNGWQSSQSHVLGSWPRTATYLERDGRVEFAVTCGDMMIWYCPTTPSPGTVIRIRPGSTPTTNGGAICCVKCEDDERYERAWASGWVAPLELANTILPRSITVSDADNRPRYVTRWRNPAGQFHWKRPNGSTEMTTPESTQVWFDETESYLVSQERRSDRAVLVVSSVQHGWSWTSDAFDPLPKLNPFVRSIRSCGEGRAAILVDSNDTKNNTYVVLIDADGNGEWVEAFGRSTEGMRRLGRTLVIDGHDPSGRTLTLASAFDHTRFNTRPFDGHLDRLTDLDDGSIATWHFANGVLSIGNFLAP